MQIIYIWYNFPPTTYNILIIYCTWHITAWFNYSIVSYIINYS